MEDMKINLITFFLRYSQSEIYKSKSSETTDCNQVLYRCLISEKHAQTLVKYTKHTVFRMYFMVLVFRKLTKLLKM